MAAGGGSKDGRAVGKDVGGRWGCTGPLGSAAQGRQGGEGHGEGQEQSHCWLTRVGLLIVRPLQHGHNPEYEELSLVHAAYHQVPV